MTRTLLTGAAALMMAGTAAADTGAHGHSVLRDIIHWMSSPAHGLFTVAALIAATAGVIYLRRRKA